jgi:uncharacterized membrane protein
LVGNPANGVLHDGGGHFLGRTCVAPLPFVSAGFFLLPLFYVGISPVSAAVAAFLFAVAHYPVFPWRYCIPKGIAYFFVALFILPHGIWSVVVAHLLVDVGLFAFRC